jgi:hypothetical protein
LEDDGSIDRHPKIVAGRAGPLNRDRPSPRTVDIRTVACCLDPAEGDRVCVGFPQAAMAVLPDGTAKTP